MFGSLGAPELLVILVVALLVFGPKKLPILQISWRSDPRIQEGDQ